MRHLLGLMMAALLLAACGEKQETEGRPCPCGPGWECCESTGMCIPEGDVCPESDGGSDGKGAAKEDGHSEEDMALEDRTEADGPADLARADRPRRDVSEGDGPEGDVPPDDDVAQGDLAPDDAPPPQDVVVEPREDVHQAQTDVVQLQEDVHQAQTDVPQPQEDVHQAQTDMPQLQEDVHQAQTDMPQLQEDVHQAQTDVAQTDVAQTDMVQTDIAQTDMAQTDVAQTDIAQTDIVQSDMAQTDIVQSDMAQSDVAQSDVAQTDMAQTDVAQSDVAQTDMAQTDVAQSDVAQSDVAQTDMVQSDIAQSDVAQTDMVQSDIAQSDVAQTDVAQSDVAQTDMAQTDVAQSDMAQSDVPQQDMALSQEDVAQSDWFLEDTPQGQEDLAFSDLPPFDDLVSADVAPMDGSHDDAVSWPDGSLGEICGDGVDNDGDGLVDCLDFDCIEQCPCYSTDHNRGVLNFFHGPVTIRAIDGSETIVVPGPRGEIPGGALLRGDMLYTVTGDRNGGVYMPGETEWLEIGIVRYYESGAFYDGIGGFVREEGVDAPGEGFRARFHEGTGDSYVAMVIEHAGLIDHVWESNPSWYYVTPYQNLGVGMAMVANDPELIALEFLPFPETPPGPEHNRGVLNFYPGEVTIQAIDGSETILVPIPRDGVPGGGLLRGDMWYTVSEDRNNGVYMPGETEWLEIGIVRYSQGGSWVDGIGGFIKEEGVDAPGEGFRARFHEGTGNSYVNMVIEPAGLIDHVWESNPPWYYVTPDQNLGVGMAMVANDPELVALEFLPFPENPPGPEHNRGVLNFYPGEVTIQAIDGSETILVPSSRDGVPGGGLLRGDMWYTVSEDRNNGVYMPGETEWLEIGIVRYPQGGSWYDGIGGFIREEDAFGEGFRARFREGTGDSYVDMVIEPAGVIDHIWESNPPWYYVTPSQNLGVSMALIANDPELIALEFLPLPETPPGPDHNRGVLNFYPGAVTIQAIDGSETILVPSPRDGIPGGGLLRGDMWYTVSEDRNNGVYMPGETEWLEMGIVRYQQGGSWYDGIGGFIKEEGVDAPGEGFRARFHEGTGASYVSMVMEPAGVIDHIWESNPPWYYVTPSQNLGADMARVTSEPELIALEFLPFPEDPPGPEYNRGVLNFSEIPATARAINGSETIEIPPTRGDIPGGALLRGNMWYFIDYDMAGSVYQLSESQWLELETGDLMLDFEVTVRNEGVDASPDGLRVRFREGTGDSYISMVLDQVGVISQVWETNPPWYFIIPYQNIGAAMAVLANEPELVALDPLPVDSCELPFWIP